MSTTWKAPADKVLVQGIQVSKETPSGIVIPDKVKKADIMQGTVLAFGPEAKGLKVGDAVFFLTKGAVEFISGGIYSMSIDYIMGAQREEFNGIDD